MGLSRKVHQHVVTIAGLAFDLSQSEFYSHPPHISNDPPTSCPHGGCPYGGAKDGQPIWTWLAWAAMLTRMRPWFLSEVTNLRNDKRANTEGGHQDQWQLVVDYGSCWQCLVIRDHKRSCLAWFISWFGRSTLGVLPFWTNLQPVETKLRKWQGKVPYEEWTRYHEEPPGNSATSQYSPRNRDKPWQKWTSLRNQSFNRPSIHPHQASLWVTWGVPPFLVPATSCCHTAQQ